jgi:hypothetical protein
MFSILTGILRKESYIFIKLKPNFMHQHIIPCRNEKMKKISSEIVYLDKINAGNRDYHSLEIVPNYENEEKDYIYYKNIFFEGENGSKIADDTKIYVLDLAFLCESNNKKFVEFEMNHPPKVTCRPGNLPLRENDLIHFTYKNKEEKLEYLIPMNGFYDGNKSNTGIGLHHEEFYGFYYITDKNGYETLKEKVIRGKILEINFDDPPKLHILGFWYSEKIEIHPEA